jgi:hypothetical protein
VILKCSFLTNGELWLTTLFQTATVKATDGREVRNGLKRCAIESYIVGTLFSSVAYVVSKKICHADLGFYM